MVGVLLPQRWADAKYQGQCVCECCFLEDSCETLTSHHGYILGVFFFWWPQLPPLLPSPTPPFPYFFLAPFLPSPAVLCLVFLQTVGIGFPCVAEEWLFIVHEIPINSVSRGFLGSPEVKTPHFHCRGLEFDSSQGTQIPYSTEQLSHSCWARVLWSPSSTATEATCHNQRALLPRKCPAGRSEDLACCKLFLRPDASNK